MTQHIGFRCPEDIIAAIKARTEASGKGRTEVLVEMLRASMPSMVVSDRSKLPQEAAIYIVWNEEQLLYIGKTDNLRNRFSNHPKLPDFMLAGVESKVSWLPATIENLSAFEHSLIEESEPQLNQVTALEKDKGRVISFGLPQELEAKILEESQQGESFNDTAKRILIDALGGQIIPLPVPTIDIEGLVSKALTEQWESANIEIKITIESLIEEKVSQIPTKIPPNIPTQTQLQEMNTRINDFRDSLLREIQNRDKSINLFAEQIALLTARLDAMPPGISREELEVARDKVLSSWRTTKGAEKKERIKQGIDKVIDEVYPQEYKIY
jgi:hypothetical protein